MVLGILTVMVMLAVAFAISMRTERLAAGNALDTVRARQLAQVGLARALDFISINQGTQGMLTSPTFGSTSYPPWNVTSSYHDVDSDAWAENFRPENVSVGDDRIAVNRVYQAGDLVSFTTTTNLPTPLTARTPYFVIPVPGEKQIQVAATYDEAVAATPTPVDLADSGSGVHTIRYVSLVNRDVTNFVPRALWNAMMPVAAANAPYCWTNILVVNVIGTNSAGEPLKETNFPGRIAYLIINCSGLLDANFAGGLDDSGANLISRGVGTNPNEIAISAIPDFQTSLLPDPDKAKIFLGHRKNRDLRYETLLDLYELNHHVDSPVPFNDSPSNFMVYSRAPAGYVFTNAWNSGVGMYSNVIKQPVNLSNDVMELIQPAYKGAIMAAFTNAGLTNDAAHLFFDAGVLYTNLIDYIDANSIPGDLNGTVSANFEIPSMEPVPMFNEIRFLWDAPLNPGDPSTVTVTYELWFPYLNKNATVTIAGSIDFGGTAIPTIQDALNAITFNSPGYSVSMSFTASAAGGPIAPQIVSAEIKMDGVTVDALQPNTLLPVSVSQDGVMNRLECLDPRNNFNPNDPQCWRVASSTINDQNDFTTGWWTTNQSWDTDAAMYVANGPLKSVGELSYLVYTNWRTVKLYGPNRSKVLDTFALSTNTTGPMEVADVCRGKINFNSNAASDALATVFYNMPVERYPGDTTVHPLNWNEAQTLAQRLFSPVVGGGYYTNLSDIGRPFTTAADFPFSGTTELEREAYFRNTCGLLTTRQQIFTIIIEAQTAAGGIFARNPPRQRAAALVWRDAFTGEMFVRWLKWLKD